MIATFLLAPCLPSPPLVPRDVTQQPSEPQAPSAFTPSGAAWTALSAMVSARGAVAYAWRSDLEASRQSSGVTDGILDGQSSGYINDWFAPGNDARAAISSVAAQKAISGEVDSVRALSFDGDRTSSASGDRYAIPHIETNTGTLIAVARLTENSAFHRTCIQIGPLRLVLRTDTLTGPQVRVGSGVHYAFSGGTAYDVWSLYCIEYNKGTNTLRYRRNGDAAWTSASVAAWGSSFNTTSWLGVNSYEPSNYDPCPMALRSAFWTSAIDLDEDELQAALDWCQEGTSIGDTAPADEVAPPPGGSIYLRTVNVSNYSELTSALAAAIPGDDIVLANGTYSGNLTASRDGTETNPIRIRAATPNSATIAGILTLSGDWNVAQSLRWGSSPTNPVQVSGSNNKVRGCWFTGSGASASASWGIVTIFDGANDNYVEYNSFTNYRFRGVCVRNATTGGRRTIIRRNYIDTNIPPASGDWGVAIGIGGSENAASWQLNMGCEIYFNYLTGVGGPAGNQIQCKSVGNYIWNNFAENCPGGRFEDRRGGMGPGLPFNRWHANKTDRGIFAFGYGGEYISNINPTGTAAWIAMGPGAGTHEWNSTTNQYYRAEAQKWFWNTGTLILGNGTSSWPLPAKNIQVGGHTGDIINRNVTGTQNITPTIAHVPHVTFGAGDVGPSAMEEDVSASALAANPFSSSSAFHRPIGSGAIYANDSHPSRIAWVAVVPANNGQGGGGTVGAINQGNPFGVAAMYASGSDPQRTVRRRNCTGTADSTLNWDPGGNSVVIRIPDTNGINTNASYQCYENTAFVVQSDYSTYEFFQTNRNGNDYRASICRVADVRGLGHGEALGDRVGVSASGCSVRMGMLSAASLLAEEEIGHALKLAIYSGYDTEAHELLGRGIQWPACNADSFASNPANNNGPFPYGALLGIPPSVDLSTLGLTTPQGYILGRAMQNYGCLAMDDADGIVLRADGSLGGSATAIVADYRKLLYHLRLITNAVSGATAAIAADGGYNQTGSIGDPYYPAGGGTPLAANTALI